MAAVPAAVAPCQRRERERPEVARKRRSEAAPNAASRAMNDERWKDRSWTPRARRTRTNAAAAAMQGASRKEEDDGLKEDAASGRSAASARMMTGERPGMQHPREKAAMADSATMARKAASEENAVITTEMANPARHHARRKRKSLVARGGEPGNPQKHARRQCSCWQLRQRQHRCNAAAWSTTAMGSLGDVINW